MTKLKLAAAAVVALMLQAQAFAGMQSGQTVSVSGAVASGSVVAARYSADTKEYIGCAISTGVANPAVTNTDATVSISLSCSAQDASGHATYCYTASPPAAWLNMMVNVNETSWIFFYGDAQGHCQGLNISQGSQYSETL